MISAFLTLISSFRLNLRIDWSGRAARRSIRITDCLRTGTVCGELVGEMTVI